MVHSEEMLVDELVDTKDEQCQLREANDHRCDVKSVQQEVATQRQVVIPPCFEKRHSASQAIYHIGCFYYLIVLNKYIITS